MHWDNTISLGALMQIATVIITVIVAYTSFLRRIEVQAEGFRQVLQVHSATLTAHADRLDRHEEHTLTMVGDLQRVIGRLETVAERTSRSSSVP